MDEVAELMRKSAETDGYQLQIDLPNQTVADSEGFTAAFEIHPYWKEMLVNGWDEISITLQYDDKIRSYENKVDTVNV